MARSNASVERFKRRLARIPDRVRDAAYQAVLAEARRIGGIIKSIVPRDSGKLAESVRLETDPKRRRVRILAGGKLTTKEVRRGSGKPFDYARGVEFGTVDTPAQPFFRPTVRRHKPAAKKSINAAMKRAFERG